MQPTLRETPIWKQLPLSKVIQTHQIMTVSVVSDLLHQSFVRDGFCNMSMTKMHVTLFHIADKLIVVSTPGHHSTPTVAATDVTY